MLEDLGWRGLLADTTDTAQLNEHLRSSRKCYIGFDPTADSLTIGNLVPIMLLRQLQLAGHTPYVVMGGGTGLIGDPSGKSLERPLLDEDVVRSNVDKQRAIFEKFLAFDGPNAARIVNNLDWLGGLGFLQALRDIGKHISVNEMMRRDAVRNRLDGQEQGLSYTEFSYSLLQAYDFAWLFANEGVTIQLGGSDQWGNIVAGLDLIRKLHRGQAFGVTTPLMTKEDGTKFGKSETGAVWLSDDRTSPYNFYQYLFNVSDADALRFNRMLSEKDQAQIESLELAAELQPAERVIQRSLAAELTDILHGGEARRRAEATSQAIFAGNVRELSRDELLDAFSSAPSATFARSRLSGSPSDFQDLLIEIGMATSRSNARNLLGSSGIYVNGQPVDESWASTDRDLLHDQVLMIRKGKKNWFIARFEG